MKIVNYFKEMYDELAHKTSWPTMQELGNSVVVVSIASLIIALIVFLMDAIFNIQFDFLFCTRDCLDHIPLAFDFCHDQLFSIQHQRLPATRNY